ncbi:Hypothetical_protein [Hexamita inflata]|uniref:Hypothetical_protein n=1 Tax=Hexamita inflata TaxID=28002 RepID=A0AA86NMQ9_9EUKA|nr:Hypothetical protein HINF_LOCUS10797 [Hexamita inflata]
MLHIQIKNELNILQQRLISLQSIIQHDTQQMENLFSIISSLDFIDELQTDQQLDQFNSNLKDLSTVLKQNRSSSLLTAEKLNELAQTFRRIRSLYTTNKRQFFSEPHDKIAPHNPSLNLSANFGLQTKKIETITSKQVRDLHAHFEKQLHSIQSQLNSVKLQIMDPSLVMQQEIPKLSQIEQALTSVQVSQPSTNHEINLEPLMQQVTELNKKLTQTVQKNASVSAQISQMQLIEPTKPAEFVKTDVETLQQLVNFSLMQTDYAISQIQVEPKITQLQNKKMTNEPSKMIQALIQKQNNKQKAYAEKMKEMEQHLALLNEQIYENQILIEGNQRRLQTIKLGM